jgi:peptide/nickel transport system substrate-binding protein
MKRLLVACLLAALAAAPVAAQTPANLVIQVPTEPPGLDLTSNPSSAIATVVFDNVQEGLIKIDRTGKLVPWLAERWYTTDSKNYTFFLRKGVRFSNGRELKAADVKFALDRAMNPETKHPYRTQYDVIQDVIVKDDYTVTVALKRVDATFLYTTARQGSVIYPREAVDSLKSQPIGTGPFTVAEWVRGDRIVLVKNKDYWVKGLPKLDRVVFRFIPDPNSTLAALKSGDIDVSAFGIGPESVDELKKDARFQVIVGDMTNDVTLSMNNSKKPYSDQRVRLAITHAINKEEVLKGAMFGYGRILGSNVDPTNPYFVDVSKRVGYDPARAK